MTKTLLSLIVAVAVAFTLTACKPSGNHEHKEGEQPGHEHGAAATKYTCPMHPEVVQDKAGDCPKCGMKLVEKK